MQIYTRAEFDLKQEYIFSEIKKGKVFIHPTDTIYGLGCDATNVEAVKKLRDIKERYSRPFSIIAPSKTWIRENCVVDQKVIEWLKKMPGPFTLILKLKNKKAVSPEVNNGLDTLGVRIVYHWFQSTVEKLDKPIVTTSANRVGYDFMTSIDNLDGAIISKIDFIVYVGEKLGKPSTVVDLTQVKESIQRK
jgi:L-threonylcarbamoyladenylate synthase